MTSIRVVLADDHLVMRDSIRDLLEHEPDINVVGEAGNGLEALRLAQELAPDVLLLDIEMPRMSGLEVARQLQTTHADIPILALSAHDDWQYIKSFLELGMAGYLIKSEAPAIIVDAVRGAARGEKGWISQQVARQLSAKTVKSQSLKE